MQGLWIKPFSEGNYLVCLDRDSAKAVHVTFNIIFEVAIRRRPQKGHSTRLNVPLCPAKRIRVGQTILGVMPLWLNNELRDLLKECLRNVNRYWAETLMSASAAARASLVFG
jgi:hypothetical protein